MTSRLESDLTTLWVIVNCSISFELSQSGLPNYALMVAVSTCCFILLRTFQPLRPVKGGLLGLLSMDIWDVSPTALLIQVFLVAVAFGAIHFAIAIKVPKSYYGINKWQDAAYFSIVTLATVGYGDIYPISFEARCASVIEITCGVMLLVYAINIFSSVWLQRKQNVDGSGSESDVAQS